MSAVAFWTRLEAEAKADRERKAAAKLRPFRILIGKRGSPRLDFACMAPDSSTAVMQHLDLAEPGERCEAVPASGAAA